MPHEVSPDIIEERVNRMKEQNPSVDGFLDVLATRPDGDLPLSKINNKDQATKPTEHQLLVEGRVTELRNSGATITRFLPALADRPDYVSPPPKR